MYLIGEDCMGHLRAAEEELVMLTVEVQRDMQKLVAAVLTVVHFPTMLVAERWTGTRAVVVG